MHQAMAFINEFGYVFLFLSMSSGMIILPLPLEAIMGYSGYLSFKGELNWLLCILAAAAGTSAGMAVNYWIGQKLGSGFITKYGHYIFLKQETMDKMAGWFLKYGNKMLIVIFFIPGARHAIGFFAGITKFPFKVYSLYSLIGSLIWTAPFILIGNMIGPGWMMYQQEAKDFLLAAGMVLLVLFLAAYIAGKTSTRVSSFGWRIRRKFINLLR